MALVCIGSVNVYAEDGTANIRDVHGAIVASSGSRVLLLLPEHHLVHDPTYYHPAEECSKCADSDHVPGARMEHDPDLHGPPTAALESYESCLARLEQT